MSAHEKMIAGPTNNVSFKWTIKFYAFNILGMKLNLSILILIVTLSSARGALMPACEKVEESSIRKCIEEIVKTSTWEPLKTNLELALKKTNNNINIKFDPKLDRAAITKVETIDNQFKPVIVLGKNTDSSELLITLNHELVHYLSTFDRLSYVYDGVKIKRCLTRYQLLTLQDEAFAFKAELEFWNQAPEEFKKHFENSFFNSKVFQRKVNYQEFYKLLSLSLAQDKNFILKKYIDMGEYSQCAKEILAD